MCITWLSLMGKAIVKPQGSDRKEIGENSRKRGQGGREGPVQIDCCIPSMYIQYYLHLDSDEAVCFIHRVGEPDGEAAHLTFTDLGIRA